MPGITLRRIKEGKKTGSPLKLDGETFMIGRSSECDIRVSSDAASRKHSIIRLEGNAWFAEDMSSRNGTFLNGKKITTAALRPSDVLKFGESGAKIQIVALDPPPATGAGGDEETRYLRVAPAAGGHAPPPPAAPPPRKAKKEKKKKEKRRAAPPARQAAPPREPKVKKGAPAWTWIFPLLGLGVGAVMAWDLWEKFDFLKPFPYWEISGPLRWVWQGIGKLNLELSADTGHWIVRGTFILYFVLWGFILRRPWKNRIFLLIFAIAHGAAIGLLSR